MRVAAAVSSGELGRFNVFWDRLLRVQGVADVLCSRSANIAENRNLLTQQALDGDFDAIWYVDDDQVFADDTLARLIAHDKDIVSGLYVKRQFPFVPHIYEARDGSGRVFQGLLKPGLSGLVECGAVAAGCLLVKLRVFEKMATPWWRLGQIEPDQWSDDLDFCARARKAGFDIFCDLETPVGHMFAGELWPARQPDGTWKTAFVDKHQAIAFWQAAMRLRDNSSERSGMES